MRTHLLISVAGFGLLGHVVSGCGAPALDDLEHGAAPPDAGGATAVAIGSRARGGSGGRQTSNRGGTNPGTTTPKGEGGAKPAASGGVASSPAEPEPESSGGAPTTRGGAASGARAATGGGKAAVSGGTSGSSSSSGGAGGAGDDASGGAEPSNGGNPTEPQGGAPPYPSGGHAGMPELTGGTPSTGGESSGGAPVSPEPPARTLWFSEYVEGSGNFKALEIAALSEQSTSGCQIEVFSNGESALPSTWALEALVSPLTPLVVCTKELNAVLDGKCLELRLIFNGNDAVVLRCDGNVVDAIGRVGEEREKQWGDGELRTLDMTLRRDCSVTAGDANATDAFDLALEWLAVAKDDFKGLGTHCTSAQ